MALETLADEATRHTDLGVVFEEHERTKAGSTTRPTGRVSPVYGGRLDKWSGKYDGPALDVLRLPVSSGQLDFLLSDAASIIAVGGRGGGKSVAAERAAIKYALQHPRALGLIVAPTHRSAQILYSKLLATLPQSWIYKVRRAPQEREIWLVNGAKLKFFSADNPDSIRGWDAEWALIDESQDVSSEAVGITMLCLRVTDDPRICETGTPKGGSDFHERHEALLGDEDGAVFRFPSLDNPFIPLRVFALAKKRMSPKLYAQEVEAQWVEDGEFVYEFWNKKLHAHPYRDRKKILEAAYGEDHKGLGRDVTNEVLLKRFPRSGDPDFLIGMDFNISPMCAAVFKVLRSPRGVADTLWCVAEVVLDEAADAQRMGRALKDEGFGDCVIVADASDSRAKSYYRALRNEGLFVTTPAKDRRNPAIRDRVNAVNGKLLNADNETTLFVDPFRAPRTCRAMAKHQRDDKGKPLPDQFSHYCDALGYAVVKLYPVRNAFPTSSHA